VDWVGFTLAGGFGVAAATEVGFATRATGFASTDVTWVDGVAGADGCDAGFATGLVANVGMGGMPAIGEIWVGSTEREPGFVPAANIGRAVGLDIGPGTSVRQLSMGRVGSVRLRS
jgi:hypothetical protein